MFTKNSKEPIKTWSNTWMIENQYHYPHVVQTNFKKEFVEKLELNKEKMVYNLVKDSKEYQTNNLQLLREIADKLKNVRFNFKLSTLK